MAPLRGSGIAGQTSQTAPPSRAVRGFLAFSSAAIGLKLVIEFVRGQDNGVSIRSKAVRVADGREYVVTGLNRWYWEVA